MSAATPLVQGNDDSTYQQPTYQQQYQPTYQPQQSYQPQQQTYQPQQQYQPQAVPYQPQQQYYQPQQPYQAQPYQPVHVQDMSYTSKKDEQNALLLLVFGIFCSLLWIINFVAYGKSPNDKARKYALVSRNLFLIEIVLYFVFTALYLILILI
ncbi:hypothetical protein QTN25_003022 [Entamoeba marina]